MLSKQVQLPVSRAKFFWFLPTSGDSRFIVASSHASANQVLPPNYRHPTRGYLAEVARG